MDGLFTTVHVVMDTWTRKQAQDGTPQLCQTPTQTTPVLAGEQRLAAVSDAFLKRCASAGHQRLPAVLVPWITISTCSLERSAMHQQAAGPLQHRVHQLWALTSSRGCHQ